MPYKRLLLSCTSIAALSLALAQTSIAEEAANTPAAAETAQASTENSAAIEQADAASNPAEQPVLVGQAVFVEPAATEAPADVATAPAAPQPQTQAAIPDKIAQRMAEHEKMLAMSPQERWEARREELNQRYDDLRKRAAEAGMELPAAAPWEQAPQWMSFEEMREQMQTQGIEMPEQPAWPRGMGPGRMLMSDEERQANRAAMMNMSPEERAAFRDKHYQQMRERAEAQGVSLPETPPWKQRAESMPSREEMAAKRQKFLNMTPEERQALREQRYQAMRAKAAEQGVEMPETPPWEQQAPLEPDWTQYQKVVAGMSPEERQACMALHRMHMSQPMMQQARPMQNMPQQGGFGPGQGYGAGPGFAPGRGFGNGPAQGYGPGYPGYGQQPGYGYGPGFQPWQGYRFE